MKNIESLIEDIYQTVEEGVEVSEDAVQSFADELSSVVKARLSPEARKGERKPLRLSSIGEHCERKVWYNANLPEEAEPLPSHVRLKFLLGDVWESVLLFLAKAAGHTVEGQQDTLNLHGIEGHRDAVIDGVTVDVKSAATPSFQKFTRPGGLTKEDDSFFYLSQLGAYHEAAKDDPLVKDKDHAAFLVGDKSLGHLVLDKKKMPKRNWEAIVARQKQIIEMENPPERGYPDFEDGKSGNRKLGTACSYCPFKKECWPEAKLYGYKPPRWLTVVKKQPKGRDGKPIPVIG